MLLLSVLLGMPLLLQAAQAEFYVDPVSGNDGNPGTSAGSAFRTIPRARSAVSTINSSMSGDILVHLMNGTHTLTSTLAFGAADSGTNGYNVVYDAYQGAAPVISGGENFSGGWYSVGSGIYARNSVSGSFRQIYVNGTRAIRARAPNLVDEATGGSYYTALNSNAPFQVDASEIGSWANSGTVEFVWNRHWLQIRNRIASYTTGSGIANLTFASPQDGYPVNHSPQAVPTYYYFENALALLDAEGEWFHDTGAQVLYYKPRAGEDMTTAQVVVPRVTTLLSIAGTSGSPAHHIQFRGLTLMHDNWTDPTTYGYYSGQAGFVYATTAGSLLGSESGEPDPPASFSPAKGMVSVSNAQNIRFERNVFTNGGSWGVMEFAGAHHNAYVGNVFTQLASGAIAIGNTPAPIRWVQLPIGTGDSDVISNNVVDAVARDYRDAVGILALRVKSTNISHNVIRNIPYTGISIGFIYNDVETFDTHNNDVGYNRIYNCMQLLDDGGGIYNLGAWTGRFHHNYISNQWPSIYSGTFPYEYHNAGIYLDQGSSHLTIDHNVVHNVGLFTFASNQPNHDNTATDNSFRSVGAARHLVSGQSPPDGYSTWTNNNDYTNTNWPGGATDSPGDIINKAGLENNYDAGLDHSYGDIDGNAAPLAQWGFNNDVYDLGFDMAFNGHDLATFGSLTNSSDRKGGATSVNLSGSGQYLRGPALPTGKTNVSLSAWVKWNGGTGIQFVMNNGGTGSTGYGMYLENGVFKVLCGGVGYVVTNTTVTPGQWTHLAAVNKNFTWTLYVNGSSVPIVSGANTVANTPNPATQFVTIGKDSGALYFSGLIDDARLYNAAIAPSVIAAMASGNDSERYLARWLFNNDATDNSGFRRHAWLQAGLTYSSDHQEGPSALGLNGSSQYAVMPLSNLSTKNLAMSAWVKWNGPTGPTHPQHFIIHNGNSGGNGYGMFINDDGRFEAICGGVDYVVSNAFVPVNLWTHLAATYVDGTWRLYVNGEPVPIASGGSTVPLTPTGSTNVGLDGTGGVMYFNGLIDDLRLYNTK